MSAGHRGHEGKPPQSELDDLLDHALADPKIKRALTQPYRFINTFDIALVGSSAIGWRHGYIDRHLHSPGLPFGWLRVDGRPLDVRPGLKRHEHLEVILENVRGWPYLPLSHFVAQNYEERYYREKGFDPAAVERTFKPFIKSDALERITKVPTDLDQRPLLAPPRSDKIIARVNEAAQKEKVSHETAGYVDPSPRKAQSCGRCFKFVQPIYGGPACIGVQSEIAESGWCRRFVRGNLAGGKLDD